MLHFKPALAFAVGALLMSATAPVTARDTLARDERLARLALAQTRLQMVKAATATVIPPKLEEQLGALLYADPILSLNRNQSCASCHALTPTRIKATPSRPTVAAFIDPRNTLTGSAVSAGSVKNRQGVLNAPSVGYAAFSPPFHWNAVDGLYMGGQFWNGRATNLAAQAAEPFLNPHEMAMPDKASVVARLQESKEYQRLFLQAFDLSLAQILTRKPYPRSGAIDAAYDAMTRAIAAFEKSRMFNRFTSKFDYSLAGLTTLSAAEQRGLEVFNGQGNCAACHPATPTFAPDGSVMPPLFTDFSYDNIGLPRNIDIPGNPAPNRGLGGRADIGARDATGADIGKHKVMSLRNVALTPPYGHNGVLHTLAEVVHFYNTRDVLPRIADIHAKGFAVSAWPAPEIARNVNRDELGALGLSAAQEADLVSFLVTLTDGYAEWGRDPRVPRGTPSPYATMPFPPMP